MANKRIDAPTGTETVGHEWDGIEELNTPLPRWWLWTFYLTIIFAIVYVVLYPAWPMVDKATEGVLGWSSRGQLAEKMSAAEMAQQGFRDQLANIPIERLPDDSALMGRTGGLQGPLHPVPRLGRCGRPAAGLPQPQRRCLAVGR